MYAIDRVVHSAAGVALVDCTGNPGRHGHDDGSGEWGRGPTTALPRSYLRPDRYCRPGPVLGRANPSTDVLSSILGGGLVAVHPSVWQASADRRWT